MSIFRKLGHNNVSYTSPQYRQGDTLQQVGSVFGSQLTTGTFFYLTKGFVAKRGLATQGDFDDDDGVDIDVLDTSISASDEETGDEYLKQKKSHSRTSTQQTNTYQDDEDHLDGEDLDELVSSPLDMVSDSLEEGTGNQKRPLWMRLEEAAGKKSTTLRDVFDEWTAEGNSISRAVIIFTITVLRKRRKFWRALEVSDWVMTEKPFELTDMDYGTRVLLISKVQGSQKAADYFATIPKEFKTAMTYSVLVTAYVEQNKEKEALSLIQEVERLGLGHRTYMYNQLLYLYKKNGLMAGVAEVLQTMDKKNVEPDVHTYNIILDVRARKGDTDGMEKVWARVKEDKNVEPDAATFAVLAKGYIKAGLLEKAEKAVKEVEESPFRKKRAVNLLLLKLYGLIGKEDDLERIWGVVIRGQKVGIADYVAMIRSLGKVGNSARAEDIFEEMQDKISNLSVHHYNALLSVYASLGRTQKGENVLKQIARAHLTPNPATYHELVHMYLKAGQEEKAMEVLSKAQKASRASIRRRPQYATFHTALEWFAGNGDVKNAEKVVRDLKSAGYMCSYRSYVTLLKAYENGRMSPYGILDRLRADNVIPNQHIRKELKKLDGT